MRSLIRLPGPADFLEAIVEDLKDGNSVLAGLPNFNSELALHFNSELAIQVSEMVKRSGLGWSAVRRAEVSRGNPEKSVKQRSNGGASRNLVLWIDGTIQDEGASAWADHVRQIAGSVEGPRLCIAMPMDSAADCGEDRGLRRRLWKSFVTSLDSRVLVERLDRRSERGQMHIALKSALIEEIAGPDLDFAAQLAKDSPGSILKADYPKEKIWAAQIKVLFPLIERERRFFRETFRDLWVLPHCRGDGEEVKNLEDLEIGDMASQARGLEALEAKRSCLDWLRRIRNDLAHMKTVPWETLISSTALQIVDFR